MSATDSYTARIGGAMPLRNYSVIDHLNLQVPILQFGFFPISYCHLMPYNLLLINFKY